MRLANLGLIEGFEADLVVSGINHGANLGDDITYSGTVAAALEGSSSASRRSPSRSSRARGELDWTFARQLRLRARGRLRRAPRRRRSSDSPLPPATLLNVNVPGDAAVGVEVTHLGKRVYRDELRLETEEEGRRRYWIYGTAPGYEDEPGTDLAAVARGRIALTPLHFDLTDRPGIAALQRLDLGRLLDRERRRRSRRPRGRAARPQLAYHARRYYVEDDPEIGDDEYDALYRELVAIETEHPELVAARLADPASRRRAGRPAREGRATCSRCSRWRTSARRRSCAHGSRGCARTSRARGSTTRRSASSASRRSTASRSR